MALNRYWRQHPPVHLLVAGYLGFKGLSQAPEEPLEIGNENEALQNFIDDFVAAGGIKV